MYNLEKLISKDKIELKKESMKIVTIFLKIPKKLLFSTTLEDYLSFYSTLSIVVSFILFV
jgi:hypothetical protein